MPKLEYYIITVLNNVLQIIGVPFGCHHCHSKKPRLEFLEEREQFRLFPLIYLPILKSILLRNYWHTKSCTYLAYIT